MLPSLLRLAWAYQDMSIFSRAREMFQSILLELRDRKSTDDVLIADVRRRIDACTSKLAERASAAKPSYSLSKRDSEGFSPEQQASIIALSTSEDAGSHDITRTSRCQEGGPRAPSSIIAAFEPSLALFPLVRAQCMLGGAGVGLVARSRIRKGTTILIDKSAFAACLSQSVRCYHCLIRIRGTAKALPCPGHALGPTGAGASGTAKKEKVVCDRVFCNSTCAEAAWRLYHAPLCAQANVLAELEGLAAKGTSASSRFMLLGWKLLGAALVKQRADGPGSPLVPPADLPPFNHLFRVSDATGSVGEGARMSPQWFMRQWSIVVRCMAGLSGLAASFAFVCVSCVL